MLKFFLTERIGIYLLPQVNLHIDEFSDDFNRRFKFLLWRMLFIFLKSWGFLNFFP